MKMLSILKEEKPVMEKKKIQTENIRTPPPPPPSQPS